MSYDAADAPAYELLHRAHESLTAAASCMHRDPDAALDDLIAARLLITTALPSLQPEPAFVG